MWPFLYLKGRAEGNLLTGKSRARSPSPVVSDGDPPHPHLRYYCHLSSPNFWIRGTSSPVIKIRVRTNINDRGPGYRGRRRHRGIAIVSRLPLSAAAIRLACARFRPSPVTHLLLSHICDRQSRGEPGVHSAAFAPKRSVAMKVSFRMLSTLLFMSVK